MIKLNESWKQENGKYKCPHCDKEYTKKGICTHIWRKHTIEGKKFTNEHQPLKKYTKHNTVWNKGLSKESDKRIDVLSKNRIEKFNNGLLKVSGSAAWSYEEHRNHALKNKFGGYRKNAGRGKKGRYKNIWCDSSWELAFLIYHIDHNIQIKRCKKKLKYIYEDKSYNYTPDFEVKSIIYEIKGFEDKKAIAKRNQHPNIKTLYYDDMKKYLDYVEDKYGKDFIRLYE